MELFILEILTESPLRYVLKTMIISTWYLETSSINFEK